jgi:hypothetical protein
VDATAGVLDHGEDVYAGPGGCDHLEEVGGEDGLGLVMLPSLVIDRELSARRLPAMLMAFTGMGLVLGLPAG